MFTYTSSYDGWGKALVSCMSGCTCSPLLLDAASTSHTSLLQTKALPTTQHANCRVQVRRMHVCRLTPPHACHTCRAA